MLSSPKPKLQGGGGCGGWNKAWCFAFWKQIDSLKFNLKETNKWMEVSLKEFTTDGQQAYEKMLMSLIIQFSSVQFSRSVVSDSLWPHELQYTRPSCPSPNPGVYSNSCPLSWWCHPTISSSVVPFFSCLQSFPASGSFPMSLCCTSGGQSTGVSASASVLPMNI